MPADDPLELALTDLREGNFSKLAPHFASRSELGDVTQIDDWLDRGRFAVHAPELDEALTCAAFLGATATVRRLLEAGVAEAGGGRSGQHALHCAASRGQVETVRLLLRHGAPLELRNMYGGTALAQTVWSALHQPLPGQHDAAEELLRAGADPATVPTPTGDPRLDALLSVHRRR